MVSYKIVPQTANPLDERDVDSRTSNDNTPTKQEAITRPQRQRRWLTYAAIALIAVVILALALGLGLGLGLKSSNNDDSSSDDSTPSNPPPTSSANSTTSNSTGTSNGTYWRPAAGSAWQIALAANPDDTTVFSAPSEYPIYDLDLYETPASIISKLHQSGHKVICYFSAGSFEDWRPDASQFPSAAIGNDLQGWHGERWLDTRDATVRGIMKQRIQMAQTNGCDGVDPDNIDGYENDSGFPLTSGDAVDYVRFLADTAHSLGLACGLKNGGDIAAEVAGDVDWELNEQCAQYDECDALAVFVQQGKPVFHIEYTEDETPSSGFVEKSCASGGVQGFSTLIKHMELDGWTATCPDGTVTGL